MPRFLDPEAFGFMATDLARLLRTEMDRRIATSNLSVTPAEVRALAHAARAGSVRQNVLAERLGVEPMTLSTLIDRLEARGLVQRVTDPADRRAKLVELTDAADPVLAEAGVIAQSIREDASRGVDPADWVVFLRVLKASRDNLLTLKREESEAA